MTVSRLIRSVGCARVLVLIAALTAVMAGGAAAYFVAAGSGTASAAIGTLNAPTEVSAHATGATVTVSWNAVAPPASGSVKYYVTRDGSVVGGTCGTAASPIAATSCTDSGVAGGDHSYVVTAVWHSFSATSAPASVTVVPLDHFTVSAPSTATAGAPFSVSVTAKDAGGNTLTRYTGTVHFTSTDSGSATSLPADYTFVAGDNGSHTFTSGVTLTTAGSRSVSVNDTVLTSKTGSSGSIDVSAASASKLAFATQPGGGTGGTAWASQPAVAIQDAFGNTVLTDTSSVTVGIASGTGATGATLVCTSNPKAAVSGVATFAGCKIDKAANGYKLTASDGSLASATSSAFDVLVGPAAQLAFTTQPGGGTGGTAWTTQPVVAVQDLGGNTVAADTSSVTLAITPGTGTTGAALSCTANPKAAASGVATFAGCKIDKVGSGYTLRATDGVLASATSSAFAITAGSAVSFAVTASATTITAGGTTNLGITALDAGGNTATSYTGSHSLTFSGAAASPSADNPTVSSATGVATGFGVATSISFASGVAAVSGANNGVAKLYKAETVNLTVTDGTASSSPLAITVNTGAATRYAWTALSAATGTKSNPCLFTCTWTALGNNQSLSGTVSVTDPFGNIVSGIGSGRSVNVAVTTNGSRGAFTSPGTTSPVALAFPATGSATSASFTWRASNGSGGNWSDVLQASSPAGQTAYTAATLTATKQ